MATVNGIKIIKRKANVITNPDDINDIINITEAEACSSSLIMEFFGKFNGKERYILSGRKGIFIPFHLGIREIFHGSD